MAECPNDPNFRTKYSLNGENDRLNNLDQKHQKEKFEYEETTK